MKYRLLTKEECHEHCVPDPSAAYVDDNDVVLLEEIISISKGPNNCPEVHIPYTTLPLQDLEAILALLKKEAQL